MIPELRINNIGIGNVGIGDVGVSDIYVSQPYINNPYIMQIAEQRIWMMEPSGAIPMDPSVVVDIEKPIVEMPGCVEVHQENARGTNENQVTDDPRANTVLCDSNAGVQPYFRPIDWDPGKLKIEDVTPPQEEQEFEPERIPPSPPDAPAAGTPDPPKTPETAEDPPCPGPMAPRIGDVAQNQTEKVSGFELQIDPKNPDGVKICVTLYEDIGVVEQFLPTPQIASTTAVIATVATGSALLAKPLAELLLRVFRPVIKKAIGTIQKKLGKTPYRMTQAEIRTNEYRKKKGLLGINFAKEHQKKLKAEKEKEKKKIEEKKSQS